MDAARNTLAPASQPASPGQPVPASQVIHSPFSQMRLKVGDTIHIGLQSGLIRARSTVTVLGWLENVCIMVTAPNEDNIRLLLKEGEPVLARVFTGQNAFAFNADVLKNVHAPFRHLHLSFPDKVESATIRSSPRCRVNLPATVSAGRGGPVDATIIDLGTNGALIETGEIADSDKNALEIACSLELHGVPVSLKLRAEILALRNKSGEAQPRCQYRVRFTNPEPNDRLILGSLVCYHMLEFPRSVI
ncbi:MAG: flagellar brake protein [Steroidobacteraceae bacterium]